jgi:hypothetical protein
VSDFIRLIYCRFNPPDAGSDSEEEPLVVDDQDSPPPPCITIHEDDTCTQQPIQIRVAVQGQIHIGRMLLLSTFIELCTGGKDEYRMEMLEEEKNKQLVENIHQYNHLLGNFINKMEVENDISETTDKKEKGQFDNHQRMLLTKVRFIMIY